MKLKHVALLSAISIVFGAIATYWYLNTPDVRNPGGGSAKAFKVGFLPVT